MQTNCPFHWKQQSRTEQIRRKNNKIQKIIHELILCISKEQLKATKKHKFYLLKLKKNQFFNNLCWLVLSTRILCSHIYLTHEDRAEQAKEEMKHNQHNNNDLWIYIFILFLYFMYKCAFKRESSSYIYKNSYYYYYYYLFYYYY